MSTSLAAVESPAPGLRGSRMDRAFALAMAAAAAIVMLALAGAAASMLWGGREAFETFGWAFFTGDTWDPGARIFGALVAIAGTLTTAAIALAIAVPISFGIALFLTEVAPPRAPARCPAA